MSAEPNLLTHIQNAENKRLRKIGKQYTEKLFKSPRNEYQNLLNTNSQLSTAVNILESSGKYRDFKSFAQRFAVCACILLVIVGIIAAGFALAFFISTIVGIVWYMRYQNLVT